MKAAGVVACSELFGGGMVAHANSSPPSASAATFRTPWAAALEGLAPDQAPASDAQRYREPLPSTAAALGRADVVEHLNARQLLHRAIDSDNRTSNHELAWRCYLDRHDAEFLGFPKFARR